MLRSVILFIALVGLSACGGDPLANVQRIDDVDVADVSPVVEAVAAPQESDESAGLFQRLLRKRQLTPEAGGDAATVSGGGEEVSADATDAAPAETAQTIKTAAPRKRGWLFGGRTKTKAVVKQADEVGVGAAGEAGQTVQLASLETAPDAAPMRQNNARRGLFGGMKSSGPAASDLREAVAGEVLPYGEIARACYAKGKKLGQEVAKYPERGAKYRVYDSAPGQVGLHSFFITGFADGCPRQFTAALAVFGSPGMYEALRYGLPVKARSKKPTDIAYEKVKSSKCGVGRTKPCGAKISRLEKNTVFLSLYNRFEGAQGWINLLLSDGKVLALDSQG